MNSESAEVKTARDDDSEDQVAIQDLDEAEEVIESPYSITSYGADYPVDSLVKRIDAGDILVPTFNWNAPDKTEVVGFQRQYVWPRPNSWSASRPHTR